MDPDGPVCPAGLTDHPEERRALLAGISLLHCIDIDRQSHAVSPFSVQVNFSRGPCQALFFATAFFLATDEGWKGGF